MRAVVIYNSQTGFTERYAHWIAKDLGCEAVSWNQRASIDITSFELVIFGSRLHASSIAGSAWIKEHIAKHPHTRFAFFAVGASPAGKDGLLHPRVQETLLAEFPPETYPNLATFYLPGGFAYKKLKLPDRLIMKVLFSQIDKLAESDPEGAELFRNMQHGFDATDPQHCASLIEYARSPTQTSNR